MLQESYSSTPVDGTNGSLSLSVAAVPVGGKATTDLWLPTDNATVNGLPAGLERYTGEQSFDLVAVNATTAVTSMATPYPWGGSYTVSLQPGINNLLFPREQFLHSSFAAGVLEGKEFPYPSGNPTPPILSEDPTAQALLTQSFGDASSPMTDLEAYWQNRSIASGPGNFSSLETGVSSTSALQVRTLLVPSTPSNNTGSLPSHPS
ncbi:MAG TPA: hypothetical protein VMG81_03665, partial [Thermoplasmata archaeon]|nr:hypothetical protein [Thermoplasmata archaeon]